MKLGQESVGLLKNLENLEEEEQLLAAQTAAKETEAQTKTVLANSEVLLALIEHQLAQTRQETCQ